MIVAVYAHVVVGSAALGLYWCVLASRKGSAFHRSAGRACLALLVVTALSVGPILFSRSGEFDPGDVIKLLYLTVCLTTVSLLARRSIRLKNDLEFFRGRGFRIAGPVLLILGLVVLAAGLAKPDPVAAVLSWVGLFYGSTMVAFSRSHGVVHTRWWMIWHLNAVCGLFNAVNGTFLFVLMKSIGFCADDAAAQALFQLLTMALALGLRLWAGRRFQAPLLMLDWRQSQRSPAPEAMRI